MRHDRHWQQRNRITKGDISALGTPLELEEPTPQETISPASPAARAEAVRPRPLVSRDVVTGAIRAMETALIMAVALLIWAAYVRDFSTSAVADYLPVIVVAGFALPIFLQLGGLYTVHALIRTFDQIARIALAWCIVFAAIFAFVFFTQAGSSYSRVWLATWFVGGIATLVLFRIGVSLLVRRWNANGQFDRQAVLVGGGGPAEAVISALENSRHRDVSIVGIFDDRTDERSPPLVAGHRKLGTVSDLVSFARQRRVDLLVVTLPLTAETRLLQLLKKLWVLPVDIRLSAYTQKLRYRPRAYSYIGNVPFLDISDKPLSDWNAVVKTIEDRVIAALALAVLSPVMLLVALAIKLDSPGRVLFKQRRYGFNNELIEVYKFRSMHAEQSDADARKLVTRDDPRVTRVGRIIRKTSLDELPQLFNVLKGSLSLVGPRPHATHAKAENRLYDEVVDGYFARHKVKPGITGWAQINGWRGETDTEEKIHRRVEHDLFYIENWSLLFDLYILARTPIALFKTEQAY
ncbi:MAG: undecaprenyl-phosphate glucose phosphotransferase [Parvibaculaceae bacterium]